MRRKSSYRVVDVVPRTIVVHCLDSRFKLAHDRFIKEELGLGTFDFMAIQIAGGAGVLARQKEMVNCFWSVTGQLDYFTKHLDIDRIILISHQDCGRYKQLKTAGQARDDAERQDLTKALEIVSRAYHAKVYAYYASFSNDGEIVFENVQPSPAKPAEIPQLVCA
jgi:carbonic anhydrase